MRFLLPLILVLPLIRAVAPAEAAPDCSGAKRCSDFTSCKAAETYFKACPRPELDRDGDGHPCETLCRFNKRR